MELGPALIGAAVGLLFGWFLHVLIRRTPMRQPINRPGPHCGNCGTAVGGVQAVATLAWLRKRNVCSICSAKLWPLAPWVEVASMLLLAFVSARLGLAWALPAYLVFFAALLVITVVDLRYYLIPNWVVYPALFTCLGLLILATVVSGDLESLLSALAGMAAAWLFFFIVWAFYPRGMGFGDVRLAALIGLLAGWINLGVVVLAILLGLLFGAASGVVLMILRIRNRHQFMPFGPFLALGAAAAILFSGPIFDWWTGSSV